MIKNDKIVGTVRRNLRRDSTISAAYLFGSYCRGTANKFSDIDIAVLYDKKVEQARYTDKQIALALKMSRILKVEVDVVVLNRMPPFFIYQILKEGILVYEHPRRHERTFEARAILDYYDFLPLRKRCEDALLASIKEF